MKQFAFFMLVTAAVLISGCGAKVTDKTVTHADQTTLMSYLDKELNRPLDKEDLLVLKAKLDSISNTLALHPDGKMMAAMQYYRGLYFLKADNRDSAKPYLNQAMAGMDSLEKGGKVYLMARIKLAGIFEKEHKPDSAMRYAWDVYQIAGKRKDTTLLTIACLNLASLYSNNGDWEMNRKYLFMGFEQARDEALKNRFANNICKYYAETNQRDSAIFFFEKHVLKDTAISGPKPHGDMLQNYGVLLMKGGNLTAAMAAYRGALVKYQEAGQHQQTVYFNMAIAFRKLKDFKQADHYLDSAKLIAVMKGDKESVMDITKVRGINNYLTGNYKLAYELLDTAFRLNQQITDSSFFVQARELETKYSVRIKDDQLRNLGAAHSASLEIAQQQRYLILALGAALVLLALLAVVLFRRRQIATQLKQTELEQRLLRSQMEPHFIFNTLAVLQSQIRSNENDKAIKYLNQFARLLRVSLENSRESFVPLEEEIEALQNYLSLQSMRFENVFDYTIEVYEGYMDDEVKIPPMLLQPFVENAVHHGMRNLGYKGKVTVQITRQDKTLHCRISDNGNGLTVAAKPTDKKSLSILITQERLAALSKETGSKASLHIVAEADGAQGTRVDMVIPFKYA